MDIVIDSGVDKADRDALDVVFKLMLKSKNNRKDIIERFGRIAKDIYNTDSEDMIVFITGLLMKIQPWFPDWEKKLDFLFASFDDSVNMLYGIVKLNILRNN
jgi:hypothetical protein